MGICSAGLPHDCALRGAILAANARAGDDTRIIDSWITGNTSGGAVVNLERILLERSTVSGNFSPNEIHAHGGGSFVNSTVSGHIGTGSAVLVTGDLAIMGCTLAGSLVIDHPWAEVNCPLRDQRQVPRPWDGDGGGGSGCDIGAVELFGPGEVFVDGVECGFTTAWSVVAF